MEKERKIRILSIGALLVAIIGLTVAFAAMSRTLIINGTATVDSAKWDIHFANPALKSKKGDAREVSAPVISEDGGDLTLKVGLRKPQDEIVYNVDVENSGDIDAEITKIDYPELSEEHAKIIEFEAVYDDGSSIELSQELKHGDSKKVKITIRFKDIEDESLLASEAYNIPLTFKIHYTQSGLSSDGEVTPDGGDVVGPDLVDPAPDLVVEDGTEYDDGYYIYKYNNFYINTKWKENTELNGWGVRVKDTSLTSYPTMKSVIGGKPVVSANYTYCQCSTLTIAPVLSIYLKSMQSTFSGCTLLTKAPTIPDSVTSLYSTFQGCTSLTEAPAIPNNVTALGSTFSGCSSLTGEVTIPASVTYMYKCFSSTKLPITMKYYSSNTAAANYSAPSNVTKVVIE